MENNCKYRGAETDPKQQEEQPTKTIQMAKYQINDIEKIKKDYEASKCVDISVLADCLSSKNTTITVADMIKHLQTFPLKKPKLKILVLF